MMKLYIILGATVGSTIGSYLPVLFGVSVFSATSILAGGAGGLVGIYFGYKLGEYYED